MVDLFVEHVLDQDELETEPEIVVRLQNRILVLFFASAACESCQQFAPTLTDFFKRLTDEVYVDRAAQLVLLNVIFLFPSSVSLDQSQEQQESFLKELPKKCLFLAYEDPYRRQLEAMEAAEIIDRSSMISEDFEGRSMRSLSDPVRRLKYMVEDEKKKKTKKKKSRGAEREKGRRVQWVHEGAERRNAEDAVSEEEEEEGNRRIDEECREKVA
ncbi:hypothetical protein VZT92_002354 [Zoarces viviparus]|uniref:Thioredoxin-like fold domain-containing protein n=1 Tax=Zoarces viviparus TaxID=48416 RepID=A0AAW1FY12_ZOAVI